MLNLKFGSLYGQDAKPDGVGAKLQAVQAQLAKLAQKGQKKVGGDAARQETIADDGGIPADKAEQIRRDEVLVREALALFGVDYNALIDMRGEGEHKSVYAKAVQANPAVIAEVAKAEQPVLAALKVALGFKPYAEFNAKYGEKPEDIKAAIKAELETEQKINDAKPVVKKTVGPVFSSHGGQRTMAQPKKMHGLKDMFGK